MNEYEKVRNIILTNQSLVLLLESASEQDDRQVRQRDAIALASKNKTSYFQISFQNKYSVDSLLNFLDIHIPRESQFQYTNLAYPPNQMRSSPSAKRLNYPQEIKPNLNQVSPSSRREHSKKRLDNIYKEMPLTTAIKKKNQNIFFIPQASESKQKLQQSQNIQKQEPFEMRNNNKESFSPRRFIKNSSNSIQNRSENSQEVSFSSLSQKYESQAMQSRQSSKLNELQSNPSSLSPSSPKQVSVMNILQNVVQAHRYKQVLQLRVTHSQNQQDIILKDIRNVLNNNLLALLDLIVKDHFPQVKSLATPQKVEEAIKTIKKSEDLLHKIYTADTYNKHYLFQFFQQYYYDDDTAIPNNQQVRSTTPTAISKQQTQSKPYNQSPFQIGRQQTQLYQNSNRDSMGIHPQVRQLLNQINLTPQLKTIPSSDIKANQQDKQIKSSAIFTKQFHNLEPITLENKKVDQNKFENALSSKRDKQFPISKQVQITRGKADKNEKNMIEAENNIESNQFMENDNYGQEHLFSFQDEDENTPLSQSQQLLQQYISQKPTINTLKDPFQQQVGFSSNLNFNQRDQSNNFLNQYQEQQQYANFS